MTLTIIRQYFASSFYLIRFMQVGIIAVKLIYNPLFYYIFQASNGENQMHVSGQNHF